LIRLLILYFSVHLFDLWGSPVPHALQFKADSEAWGKKIKTMQKEHKAVEEQKLKSEASLVRVCREVPMT
jgi:hypothetical protein